MILGSPSAQMSHYRCWKLDQSNGSHRFGMFLALCLKFKTDQAQDAKKMEKLNNIFFTLMARGPDVDLTEISGKEQVEAQPSKKGRGRKQ
ncbi:hypothetical protein GIB67_002447 [Kingdonia uniflora]|uniref:Signal recognition particle 9 kDa protein n=1 Tax=Kingdonia uniflora TaxID=39325 RepID=A0A7J7NC17_9MAGN|nr:hypothetical protein GIB67_002447 [Kingdonia uniflora]